MRGEEWVFEDEDCGEYFAQLDGVLDEDDTELEEEVQEAVRGDVGLAAVARLLAFDPDTMLQDSSNPFKLKVVPRSALFQPQYAPSNENSLDYPIASHPPTK